MTGMVILLIAAALGTTLFAALHYALRDFSLRKLEDIAGRNGGIGKLEPILNDAEGHALATGAIRTIGTILMLIAIVVIIHPFSIDEEGAALRPDWIRLAITGLVSWAFVFIFSNALSSSIADHLGEKMIHSFAPLIRATYYLASPVRLFAAVDPVIKRLAGEGDTTEKEELEDQILSAVTEGEREGNLDSVEVRMIEAVVEFKSQTVEEIMTPRTEIEGLGLTSDLNEITTFIAESGHSRIPVYEEDLDHIVGILYAKDLLPFAGQAVTNFDLRPVLRSAFFVPETKPLNELLLELQNRKVHMAIALDEYGGTTGLVTIEDLLEEIVGEIQDEYELEEPEGPDIMVDVHARQAEMEARAYIDDANEQLDAIGIQLPESEDYETVGGFVVTAMGRIPEPGEQFTENGFLVTVLAAEATRVNRLRVEASVAVEEEAASDTEE